MSNLVQIQKHLTELQDEDDRKKFLGVFYGRVMNHYNNGVDPIDEDLPTLKKLGMDEVSIEEVYDVVADAYKQDTFKAHGDSMVTEALNYIQLGARVEPINAYYTTV